MRTLRFWAMGRSEVRWVRLGDFIEPYNKKCGNPNAEVSGVNIYKEFMLSHANLTNTDISSYSSVPSKCFATNLMHIGRDERIPIAFNNTENELVVTSAYSVFRVKDGKSAEIIEDYIFLFFNSKEIDRLAWFYTDASVRGNLKESRLLDIKIPLPYRDGKPDVERQREVVETWQGLRRMKEQNEKMAEPLLQLCRSFMENLKKNCAPVAIGQFIEPVDERNEDGKYTENDVVGLSTSKEIITTKANLQGVDLSGYKVFRPKEFAYVCDTSRRGDKVSLAMNKTNNTYLVSSISVVFKAKGELLPDFLYLWFKRPEFDRYARFHSWGSAREAFTYEEMEKVQIPLPDIETQRAIVNIYHCAEESRRIAREADRLSREICPALMQHVIHETV